MARCKWHRMPRHWTPCSEHNRATVLLFHCRSPAPTVCQARCFLVPLTSFWEIVSCHLFGACLMKVVRIPGRWDENIITSLTSVSSRSSKYSEDYTHTHTYTHSRDAWLVPQPFEINRLSLAVLLSWCLGWTDRHTHRHTDSHTPGWQGTKSKRTVYERSSHRDWPSVTVGPAYLVFWTWQVLACDQREGEHGYGSAGASSGPDFPDLWGRCPDPQCGLHEGSAVAAQDTCHERSVQV